MGSPSSLVGDSVGGKTGVSVGSPSSLVGDSVGGPSGVSGESVGATTGASVGSPSSPLGDSVGTTWGDVVTPDKQKYSTDSESSPAQSGTAPRVKATAEHQWTGRRAQDSAHEQALGSQRHMPSTSDHAIKLPHTNLQRHSIAGQAWQAGRATRGQSRTVAAAGVGLQANVVAEAERVEEGRVGVTRWAVAVTQHSVREHVRDVGELARAERLRGGNGARCSGGLCTRAVPRGARGSSMSAQRRQTVGC